MTHSAQRIVSLLPSSTEICFALGLGDRVVGVSHECDFPSGVRGRPVLTEAKIDASASSAEIDRAVRELVSDGLSVYRIDEGPSPRPPSGPDRHPGRLRSVRGVLRPRAGSRVPVAR